MASLRSVLLTALPKVALSRCTGLFARIPLPKPVRRPFYRWFARRYGANLEEIDGDLTDFQSLQRFFQRGLRSDARPIADTALVWPCDGRIVNSGPIDNGRIPQVKNVDYSVGELVGDDSLAEQLHDGTQVTIYLAPGDYHRVHSPFDCTIEAVTALPGTLFPVNPPAVRCIPRLFVRNARHVLRCRLPDGRLAATVLVGAFNVGGTRITVEPGQSIAKGDEVGQFGFGSTVVALLAKGQPGFGVTPGDSVVRMGGAAKVDD
ncbi:MAG: archaetidylserine decarboxylase [Planctomycetota bacterium]|nr:archaetidylserine decarboxylase [Planctomycetota bacterium]